MKTTSQDVSSFSGDHLWTQPKPLAQPGPVAPGRGSDGAQPCPALCTQPEAPDSGRCQKSVSVLPAEGPLMTPKHTSKGCSHRPLAHLSISRTNPAQGGAFSNPLRVPACPSAQAPPARHREGRCSSEACAHSRVSLRDHWEPGPRGPWLLAWTPAGAPGLRGQPPASERRICQTHS